MSEADQKKFGLEIAQYGLTAIVSLQGELIKITGINPKFITSSNGVANGFFSSIDIFQAETKEESVVEAFGAFGATVGGLIGAAFGGGVGLLLAPPLTIPAAIGAGGVGATFVEEAFERATRDVIAATKYVYKAISDWINGPADEAEDAPHSTDTNNATPQESDDNTDAPTIIAIDIIGDKRSYFSDMGDQDLSAQGGFDQSSYDANEGFGAPDTAAIDAAIAAEQEAARIAAEAEARQKAVEEEAARIAAEEAARQRELEEQSARQKAAEELAKQRERAAEERRLEEEAARQKAAEEAKKKKQSQDNNSDSGNKGGSGVSWTNSTTDSDWHSTVGGNYPPVLIDLDGDGDITIIHYEDSTILFDGDGDGFGNRAAWVGPQDGFLAYDKDEDGIIRDHDELSFLSYLEGAKTDLEGLAYFDTNQNGLLDQDDEAWHQFHIFQDFNSNGITDEGELTPLDEMEIISLALTSDGNARYNDSAYIYGETSFTKSDGTTIAGFDTALEISRTGYALQNFADSVLQLMKDVDGHITRAVTYSDDDVHSLSLTDDNNVSSVIGGEGADIFTNDRQAGAVLMGRGGDDVLQGNVGQDILQGGRGDDRLAGGAGNDIYLFARGDGHDVIYDESSLAEGGDTILFGPDIAASDIMLRRDGWDMVIYLRDEEGLNTDMVDLSDSLRIAAWGFTAHRIETLQFSDGISLDISEVNRTVTTDLVLGSLTETISNNPDERETGQEWRNYSVRNDVAAMLNGRIRIGGDSIDRMSGTVGNDTYYSFDSNDIIYGYLGNDTLEGGAGADILNGGEGFDFAAYLTSPAAVIVNLATNEASGGHAEGDVLLNIERLVGSAYDDSLTGDGAANWLEGGSGADRLYGAENDDTLDGGEGADTLDGGEGADRAFYMKSHAAITVDLAANTASGGHADGDILINIERIFGSPFNDTLKGDDKDNILQGRHGDDYLYGGEGNDRLIAGNDNDTLDGGVGADTLFGGDGNDTFYFSSFRLKYTDIIADFGIGDDIIHLVHMKTEDIRIASGHGEAIRQNDYGDSTVEDAILYQTHGTADHADDIAFAILIDHNADGLILTEGTNYITIA